MLEKNNKILTVYVLRDRKGKLYKGVTSDLQRRLYQHNNGLSGWTKNRGPFKLVYKKLFATKSEALKYEKYLKSGLGREFLKEKINIP